MTLNAQKRKKFVENHFDDCGDVISSVVKDTDTYHAIAVNHDELSESSDEDDYSYLSYMVWGSNMLHNVTISPMTLQASSMEEAIYLLQPIGPGIDIAELCGGAARATTFAVCRSLRAGPNFDLVTGVDLNNCKDQELTKKCTDKRQPRTCGSNGTSREALSDPWADSSNMSSLMRGRDHMI